MNLVSQSSSSAHAEALSKGLARSLHNEKMPPIEYLVEVNPDSMIAVRQEDEDDAAVRAHELRALLSASLMLRGLTLGAFAPRPADLIWGFDQISLAMNKRNLHESKRAVVSNENMVQTRIVVTKPQLRASWRDGVGLPHPHQRWDLHGIHSVSQVLGHRKKGSKWLTQLRAIGVRINDACCARTHQHQLQMAVSTIESLMCTQEFSQVRERAETFVLRDSNSLTVKDILAARHDAVHQGKLPKDPAPYAKTALVSAWLIFDFACSFAIKYPSREQWEAYLNYRAHQNQMLSYIEGFDSSAADGIRSSIKEKVEQLFAFQLTIEAPKL